MTDFYPPHFEEKRKESPGEAASKWGGYIVMGLRYFDFQLTDKGVDAVHRLVLEAQMNWHRWLRKYGKTST